MRLDLSPLENAVEQLDDGPVLYDSDIVLQHPEIRGQMRAGAIQAFEFTYELSIRMIKRYLEQVSANPAEVDQLEFRNLVQRAPEQELLHSDLNAWMEHRRNRGLTSHVYNEAMAERVFQAAQDFLVEVRYLLRGLQERNERLD
jgi:nucleotidyltransferase substrate binding protein (TIGR01987 family)